MENEWTLQEARMHGDGSPQFVIRDGYIDEDEPDFQYFKKKNMNSWGPIS